MFDVFEGGFRKRYIVVSDTEPEGQYVVGCREDSRALDLAVVVNADGEIALKEAHAHTFEDQDAQLATLRKD